jgi:hypothetical protein
MKAYAKTFCFRPVVLGRCNRDCVSAPAQFQSQRKTRVEVAERPDRGEEDSLGLGGACQSEMGRAFWNYQAAKRWVYFFL